MHNDYYYTDIKGTPFRWVKKRTILTIINNSVFTWCIYSIHGPIYAVYIIM